MSERHREEVEIAMRQVREQLQSQLTNQMMESLVQKCFKQCVPKPGAVLSVNEDRCLQNCGEKFLSSRQLVAERLMEDFSVGRK